MLSKDYIGCELFCLIAKVLAFFWSIDAIETDFFTSIVMQNGYSVTVADTDNLALPCQ